MSDLADVLVDTIRELSAARYEASAYRVWFRASLDKLHELDREVERQRQTIARLCAETRRPRGVVTASEAA